jgi:hypothetical protein
MKVPRKKPAASKKSAASKQPAPAKKPPESKKGPAGKSPSPSKKPPGPKKMLPKQSGTAKKSAASKKAQEAGSGLEEVLERMRRQNALPENQNCVWVVELVIPPGTFMARRLEGPIDPAALDEEIAASIVALRTGNDPERHRFLITTIDVGGVARQYAKAMCEDIPNPTVPMRPYDLFTIDAVLHAQFIGDEDY